MTTETVILSQLSENKANPRKITERKLPNGIKDNQRHLGSQANQGREL